MLHVPFNKRCSQALNICLFSSLLGADSLISLHEYWLADFNFSITLLGQFLEDMEAYSEVSTNNVFKGAISSRSEQTFSRAWNRCPSLRWTRWLQITASFMQQQRQYDLIMLCIIFSHWVTLKLALRFHALLIVAIFYLLRNCVFNLFNNLDYKSPKLWKTDFMVAILGVFH